MSGPATAPIAPNARAIGRSLRIYHAPGRAGRLDGFHGRFVGTGDLAFDIGAHVGDRTASFRRLGARVVAVEPQPPLARVLTHLFARDPLITLLTDLIGARPGSATLWLNRRNPTISTASTGFIQATEGKPGWEDEVWDTAIERPVTTLDALIAHHGAPAVIKIDVEGYEAEVLAGLTTAPAALSFEFTTIQRDVARLCLDRLTALGDRWFNACLGESMTFELGTPGSATAMAGWIDRLPHAANSGDVYASLEPGRLVSR